METKTRHKHLFLGPSEGHQGGGHHKTHQKVTKPLPKRVATTTKQIKKKVVPLPRTNKLAGINFESSQAA